MKNIHFIVNEREFELWVNDKCITDCFSLDGDEAELMEQLVEFADVPCYEEKLDYEEVKARIDKAKRQ